MSSFTTVVGVDIEHERELRLAWPTWREHRPEIMENPLVLACCGDQADEREWNDALWYVDHPDMRVLAIRPLYCFGDKHRWKMFQVLVEAANTAETDYVLKLDTDAVAFRGSWPIREWLDERPAIVAPPWGYTRPIAHMVSMQQWCYSPAGRAIEADSSLVRWTPWPADRASVARVIGWCMLIDTQFHRAITRHQPILPIASHDTFFWYVAQATGRTVLAKKMYSWRHVSTSDGLGKLRAACEASVGVEV